MMKSLRNLSLFFLLSVSAQVLSCYLEAPEQSAKSLEDLRQDATQELRIAARAGDSLTMADCIFRGADVNDREGCTTCPVKSVLSLAIDKASENNESEYKGFDAVKLLLDSGADIEALSDVPAECNKLEPKVSLFPPLSYAIMVDAPLKIISLLRWRGANVQRADIIGLGWTPYRIAALYKNYEVMEMLKAAGVETDDLFPELSF